MKIKQILKVFTSFFVVIVSILSLVSIAAPTASAYQCPAGEEYHSSDSSCWKTAAPTGAHGSQCPDGFGQAASGKACYQRTNSIPTFENGDKATMTCANGQEYHASDNQCWTRSTKSPTRGTSCPAGYNYDTTAQTCIGYSNPSSPTIGKDYFADYCGTSYKGNTEACKDGQSGSDCSKYTSDADKKACQNGVASKLCGVSDGTGTSNSADARRDCYTGVVNCLNVPQEQQADCLNKVSGADPKKTGDYTSTGSSDPNKYGNCGQAQTVIIECGTEKGAVAIGKVLKIILSVLTVIVGVAAVGGLAWASVLYAKAEDNEGNTKEAKELMRNVVIGLFLYGFMVAIIGWLVPGSVIGG